MPNEYSVTTKTFDEATLQRRREEFRKKQDARLAKYPKAWWDPKYYADPANANAVASIAPPGQEASVITQAGWQRQQIASRASMLGEGNQAMLRRYLDTGYVSPGTGAALTEIASQMELPDEIITQISAADAAAAAAEDSNELGDRNPDKESQADNNNLASILGEITRPAFALMMMPQEMVMGAVRNTVGMFSGQDPDTQPSPFEQSLGGQYLSGLADFGGGESADLGEGWFPRGDVAARQAAAARDAAPLVHGRAWTVGRGVGSLIYDDPESLAYNNLSGFIDIVASIATDPLILTGAPALGARAAQTGRRTAEATRIGRTAQAEAGEQALRQPETWISGETKGAASEYVRDAMKGAVDAPRRRGASSVSDRVVQAEARFDRTADSLLVARSDASAASRRSVTSEQLTRRMSDRIRRLRNNLSDDVIQTRAKMTAGQMPDIPEGVFTDAIPARAATLPGAVDKTEAIVSVGSRSNLKSVDDLIDAPADIANRLRTLKGVSETRTKAITSVREVAKRPNASYGDLISAAINRKVTGPLLVALREAGVDGVTDVFRLADGDGGVWWTTPDVDLARWANGEWKVVDNTLESAQQRARQLDTARKAAQADRGNAARAIAVAETTAAENAKFFSAVVDEKMAISDAPAAVRQVVEYAMGVRRGLGGAPKVDYDAVREFLVGTPKSFDQAVGARMTLKEKAASGASRALVGVGTMGVSEVARLGGKLIKQPFMATARQKIFDDFVKLSDTPENLGKLHRLTNGKMPPAVLRSILRAQNEDEVLSAIAPHLGVAINRPITPSALGAVRARTSQVRMGRTNWRLFGRAKEWMIDEAERLGSIAPRGDVAINFADPVRSSQVLRNYLTNIPGLDQSVTDRIVGRFLGAESEVGRSRAVTRGFDEVADSLIRHNSELKRTATGREFSQATKDALASKLKDATKVYEGGRAKVNDWWTEHYAADAKASVMTQDGKLIELPGPQLEAELARGGLMLPDIRRIRGAIGRWGNYLDSETNFSRGVRNFTNYTNDVWRASILLRPAYVLRNIGEMQSRMFLAGHQTIFTNPLAVLGFAAAASTRSGAMTNLMARFARANKTATGYSFEKPTMGAIAAEDDALREFQDIMTRTKSRQDMRDFRAAEKFHNVAEVSIGQPGFNLGLADKLTQLNSSRLARIVAGRDPDEVARAVAQGQDREQAIIDWLINSRAGQSIRNEYADGDSTFAKIFGNPRTGTPPDPVAMRGFLFDGEASIKRRIAYYTGGDESLVNFIATGQLNRRGETLFDMNVRRSVVGRKKEVIDAQRYEQLLQQRVPTLAGKIKPIVDSFPDDTKLYMRVLRGSDAGIPQRGAKLDQLFDWFFHWAGRVENASSVGPEFAYAYHQKLAELLPAVRGADRQRIFDTVKASEGRLRRGSETMYTARAGIKAEKEGFLTIDDASTVAAQHASEHVKTFFYDAMRRRQIFHAMRVAFPFIQPFFDTLWRWGQLAAQRPYILEKVGRLGVAAQEEGSSVIYDDFDYIDPFSNQPWRDPTQGFLYEDPQSGEQTFAFPLIGSALGSVMGPISSMMGGPGSQDLAGMATLTAPLKHLNIALQGDIDYLPGLGPLITLPTSQIMPDDWFGTLPEWFQEWAYPYGKPDLSGGFVESTFFPSWARRMTGVLYNDEFRAYSIKGTMAHLLSTREYPGLHGNPAMQQQFKKDVNSTSKMMTFIRAIGAAVLPAAPTQDIYTVDKDGRFIASNYLADRYQHLLTESGDDSEAATDAFLRTYGTDAIGAIIPSTEGEFSFSGVAWEFYKDNPKKGEAYSDVIGLFFPGDFSLEAYSFQRDSGARRALSVDERITKVLAYMYQAEKRQIEQKAASQLWDQDATDEALGELEETYGGVLPSFSGITTEDMLDRARRALDQFPELAKTRGGQGSSLAFEAYDRYKVEAEQRWGEGAGLASERATSLRRQFLYELNQLTAQYGGKNKGDGSVHTIATMFARLVEPEGE